MIFLLLVPIIVGLVLPPSGVSAQTVPDVVVDISADLMKADISLGANVILAYYGNVTITGGTVNGLTFEADIIGEDWEVTISPKTYVPVAGDSMVPFDGTVAVPMTIQDDDYTLLVTVKVDTPTVYPYLTETDTMTVRVIKDRVLVEVQQPSSVELDSKPYPQVFVFSFKVINRGLTDDELRMELGRGIGLRDKGWLLDILGMEVVVGELVPAETFIYVNLNVTVPADAGNGTHEISLTVESGETGSTSEASAFVTVHAAPPPPVAKPRDDSWSFLGLDYMAWFMISLAVVGVCMIFVLGGTEIGLFALFVHILVPLYCRLKKDKVLDNFTRGQIYGFIKANPGAHYMEIQNHLEMANGVLAHHLKVLEREEFIKIHRDGLYKRFYPKHVKVSRKGKHLNRLQRDLIEEVERHPGIGQKMLSRYLGESKQVISYHVKVLSKAGLIRVDREGGATKLYSRASHRTRVGKDFVEAEVVEDDETVKVDVDPVSSRLG